MEKAANATLSKASVSVASNIPTARYRPKGIMAVPLPLKKVMERYRNISGDSGVYAYEIGPDFIKVQFSGTRQIYTYSYSGKAGITHVDRMKSLAKSGSGLNSYINKYAKYLYD